MTRRQTTATIVILLVMAIIVQALVIHFRPAPEVTSGFGPQRSGYTITDLTYFDYTDDGHLQLRVKSPFLERREADQSYYFDKPDFLLPQEAQPPWYGTSAYGWINGDGTLLELSGKVDMYQDALDDRPSAEMHTADATIWPREQRLASDAPSQMRQGTNRMRGVGLRANLDTSYLELQNDFHGIFTPAKRR